MYIYIQKRVKSPTLISIDPFYGTSISYTKVKSTVFLSLQEIIIYFHDDIFSSNFHIHDKVGIAFPGHLGLSGNVKCWVRKWTAKCDAVAPISCYFSLLVCSETHTVYINWLKQIQLKITNTLLCCYMPEGSHLYITRANEHCQKD